MVTNNDTKEVTDSKDKSGINSSEIMYLGLDLGTSQSAIATNNGLMLNIPSIVGWPKDFIAYNVVKKKIVFGEDCIKNRTSLDVVYPLEKGVIKYRNSSSSDNKVNDREANAAVELLKYLLGFVEKNKDQKIFAVVGTPARAELADKQAIIDAAEGLVDSILVVSEPFLVAYNLGIIEFAIIVDIGAGTLDICRMSGTIPEETDQKTLFIAGNEIDKKFFELMKDKIPGIHITLNLARKIKEEYAFVGEGPERVDVDFYVDGKLTTVDVSNELREACSIVVPEICNRVRDLIVSFDPEYIPVLFKNVFLTGGGSKIKGLDKEIEINLSELGSAKVTVVDDPFFQGALGSLKLGKEIPFDAWEPLLIQQ